MASRKRSDPTTPHAKRERVRAWGNAPVSKPREEATAPLPAWLDGSAAGRDALPKRPPGAK